MDRFGAPNSAYLFTGIGSVITVPSPFAAGDNDFTVAMWLAPTVVGDSSWHAFVGYESDRARSPSAFVNSNEAALPYSPAGQGSDLHWDTRTTQNGDGSRHAGVVPNWFSVRTYVHTVWAATAGRRIVFTRTAS